MSNITQFPTEERAVTPVISIVLTVAIVVIGATAISAVALGEASGISSPAPQVIFAFNTDDVTGDVIITKRGGATFGGDQVKFSGAALEKTTYGSITEWAGKTVTSGDSAAVDVKPGETLRLVWQSPSGGSEAILAKYDVPNDVGPTASVGSINPRPTQNLVEITNIQFSRVSDGTVYVVVERTVGNRVGTDTYESEFSTNGGDLTATGFGDPGRSSSMITVTVYETKSKLTELATMKSTFSGSGSGGISRPGRR